VAGGDLELTTSQTSPPIAYIDGDPLTTSGVVFPGSSYLDAVINNGEFITFSFDREYLTWGAYINPHANSLGATISVFLDGTEEGTYDLPGTDDTEFFGLIADEPFSRLIIRAPTGGTGTLAYHGIDNVGAHAAPVPSSLALLAVGLFGTLLRRRGHT
jgi:hypothetical protein